MARKFSGRAQKVMSLADAEARRLNHASVGPDHLFLGLLREGSGVAAHTLKRLLAPPQSGSCADLRLLLFEAERCVAAAPATGGNLQTRLSLNPEAERAVSDAIEESKSFDHDYIGTEHLLLGLLRQPGAAQQIVSSRGFTLEQVRESVSNLLSTAPAKRPGPVARLTQWVGRPFKRSSRARHGS